MSKCRILIWIKRVIICPNACDGLLLFTLFVNFAAILLRMVKENGHKVKKQATVAQSTVTHKAGLPQSTVFKFSFLQQAIILLCIAFGFYFNSLFNQYALDDGVVIIHNHYVQEGFKGIPKILTSDSYQSFYNEMHSDQMLAGGRYRPLSEVLFAIEHQFFGNSPLLGHLMNVVYFLCIVFCLFYFLRECFFIRMPGGGDIAFLATLLFVIHPIHTEVVANIKSSDELLSLLFILLTLIFVYKNAFHKKMKYVLYGSLSLFLALLSKEYGVIMLVIIPLFLYIVVKQKVSNAIKNTIPYLGVMMVYFILRISAVGLIHHHIDLTDPAVNPYAGATGAEKWASEIFILSKYLYMLFVPYPLCCDYSYNQIPYHHFSQIAVWLSFVMYVGIIAWSMWLVYRRNLLSILVLFFLLSILLISNFLIDVGATMAERFVFSASVGFTGLLSFAFVKMTEGIALRRRQMLYVVLFSFLTISCCVETVARNAEWKDDFTLFTHDVHTADNSFLANGNAGAFLLNYAEKQGDTSKIVPITRSAMVYLHKAVQINYRDINSHINLGLAYAVLDIPDSAMACADFAKYLNSQQPFLKTEYHLIGVRYYNRGIVAGRAGNRRLAVEDINKSLQLDPDNSFTWYNFGRYYLKLHENDSAKYCWLKALSIKPDYKEAKLVLDSLNSIRMPRNN